MNFIHVYLIKAAFKIMYKLKQLVLFLGKKLLRMVIKPKKRRDVDSINFRISIVTDNLFMDCTVYSKWGIKEIKRIKNWCEIKNDLAKAHNKKYIISSMYTIPEELKTFLIKNDVGFEERK